MAAQLYDDITTTSQYFDKHSHLEEQEYFRKLGASTTLYIGNLSFFTHESQIISYFSRCGILKSVIMGLNKVKKTPCGFCFVEFHLRQDAQQAIDCLNHSKIDGRIIRVDWDIGFKKGRQFGRGRSGGQVRDELREEQDRDRPKEQREKQGYQGKRFKRSDLLDSDNNKENNQNQQNTPVIKADPWAQLTENCDKQNLTPQYDQWQDTSDIKAGLKRIKKEEPVDDPWANIDTQQQELNTPQW